MILSISGASGSGKTFLIRHLAAMPNITRARSFSTRPPRSGESNSLLRHLSNEEFDERAASDEWLWTVRLHAYWYGTLREDILKGLLNQQSWLVLDIAPAVVPILLRYAVETRSTTELYSTYILAPDMESLRSRLVKRGDDPDSIRERLNDCASWDAEARITQVYALLLPGYGDIKQNVGHLQRFMESVKPNVQLKSGERKSDLN